MEGGVRDMSTNNIEKGRIICPACEYECSGVEETKNIIRYHHQGMKTMIGGYEVEDSWCDIIKEDFVEETTSVGRGRYPVERNGHRRGRFHNA
jgi:hypothetical protein